MTLDDGLACDGTGRIDRGTPSSSQLLRKQSICTYLPSLLLQYFTSLTSRREKADLTCASSLTSISRFGFVQLIPQLIINYKLKVKKALHPSIILFSSTRTDGATIALLFPPTSF
jgi:hypothetical protein